MKKLLYLLLVLMMMLLTSCTEQAGLSNVAGSVGTTESAPAASVSIDSANVPAASETDASSGISVESPMTVSDNSIDFNGNKANLRLKMINGKYYEDWNPGAIMGTIWEGSFILEFSDEYGSSIAQTDLTEYYSEPMIFTSNFKLEFDDYNNDGNMDFTLGQYASSNGRLYRLFTLKPDGTIEELKISGMSELFISDSSGTYSTKLQKSGNTAFSVRYYDNSQGKTFESSYEWKDGTFMGIGTKEILP